MNLVFGPFQHLTELWWTLASELRVEPRARIELLRLFESEVRDSARSIRGAVDLIVVHHQEVTILGLEHIQLDGVSSVGQSLLESRHRILGRSRSCAAMANDTVKRVPVPRVRDDHIEKRSLSALTHRGARHERC